MTETAAQYRLSVAELVRAWEAAALDSLPETTVAVDDVTGV